MKDRLLFFGAALIGITFLLVIALSWLQPAARSGTQTRRQMDGLPMQLQALESALTAAETLDAWKTSWSEDAEIVTAAATIYHGEDAAQPWSFQIYSKDRRKIATVVVRGQDVRMLQQQAALYQQQPLARTDWEIDSETVLADWWQIHGDVLWSKMDGGSLSLHLSTYSSTGTPTWRITALTSSSTPLAILEIRADTGERISQDHAGGQE